MSWIARKSTFLARQFSRRRRACASSCKIRLFSIEASKVSSSIDEEQNSQDLHYDVVIVGGGLIGTACAIALGSSPAFVDKKVLLLEASKGFAVSSPPEVHSNKDDSTDFSNRVFALSPGSKTFLESINVWPNIWRHQEVSSLQVWDALSESNISIANEGYLNPVSYIVENPVLLYALNNVLKQVKNVTTEFGSRLTNCSIPNASNTTELAKVELADGKKVSTNLLIGADGFNSRVRTAIDSPYLHGNYDRTAIVATLQLMETCDNNIAWQRFLPTGGPIALLPLSSNLSSLVWSTTIDNAKKLMALSEDEFAYEVNSALWKEYPRSPLVQKSFDIVSSFCKQSPRMLPPSIGGVVKNSRATFPLGFGHAAYYVNRSAALIGDAAHRVHPLGGQGLNLGFGDVSCLVQILEKSVSLGESLGTVESLKHYETERQRHNVVIQSGLDFLHRLYSFDFAPVVACRTLGLSFINSSDRLKQCIIAQAAA